MKKFIFLAVLVITSGMVAAQATPPKPATDAFAKMFPGASEIQWEQEEINIWDADFKLGDIEKGASFSSDGAWLMTETIISKRELPAEIFKTIALVFEGFNIEEIEKIEEDSSIGYEIVLEKGNTEVEIQAAEDGTFTLEAIEVDDEGNGMPCCKHMQQGCMHMTNMAGKGGAEGSDSGDED